MTHINQRRDTAANWTSANPVLQDGEVGWEKVTGKAKQGDGVTHWVDLPYLVTKSSVGLDSVDNTSDLDKPVSTAQQTALDLKVNKYTALANGTDLNTIVTSGNYRGSALVNAPAGSADGFVLVSGNGNTYCVQMMTTYDGTGIHVRTNNSGTWSAWFSIGSDSPVFTGNPQAPTPATADNDTSIATTAFVQAQATATKALTHKDLTDATNTFPPLGLIGTIVVTSDSAFPKASYPGLQAVKVRLVGGGGQGGGVVATGAGLCATGGPGGGGGYAEKFILASALPASTPITIGVGGNGGAAGANGAAGGTTSFGTFVSATGGAGGAFGAAVTPPSTSGGAAGVGGNGVSGDINIPGGSGMDGFCLSATRALMQSGGSSMLSTPGPRGTWTAIGVPGGTGQKYGGGGGGAANAQSQAAAQAGGNGADGVVIIEMYK